MHQLNLLTFIILFTSSLSATVVLSSPLKNVGSFYPEYFMDIPKNRVVGGREASRYQLPYQISLEYFGWSHICGGSVITPNYVLTAAHCISDDAVASYRIVAGILNRGELTSDTQFRIVSATTNHPAWPGGYGVAANDISLLQLAESLTYTKAVQAIRLPQAESDFFGSAILSGWGMTSSSSPLSITLQWLEQQLLTNDECAAALIAASGTARPLSDNMICTSGSTETSSCNADSGGPLAQNGTLIGIVSWGLNPCGEINLPSVFTRVSSFVNWIEANVNNLV